MTSPSRKGVRITRIDLDSLFEFLEISHYVHTDVYKGVAKGSIFYNTLFPPNLNPRPLRNLRKCMTSMPPVFPFCFSVLTFTRTLVTTLIPPSLVATGEPNIHPMISNCTYVLCIISLCWIPGLLWHEGVAIFVADLGCWWYQAWTVEPKSEVRKTFYLFQVHAKIILQTLTFLLNLLSRICKIIKPTSMTSVVLLTSI